MDRQTLIVAFSAAAFLYGLYMMLFCMRAPNPKRRFTVGVICVLGGAAISTYQFFHL